MNRERLYDVVVVGGGPAGLTAALYLARACYRVLVVEKERFGGQITITEQVVNYPGVFSASGKELTETMRRQAESFGAEFRLAEVTGFELSGDIKTVHTDKGDVETYGILLATGARPRMIGFPGEADYRGRGIAYCATCDGEFFRDKDVFVVGGGFAAAEESVFLTKYARHVTLLIREDDFTCAEATARPARSHPKITVHTNTEVVEVTGDNALKTIRYRNNVTGEEHTHISPDGIGVFVFAGYEPATDLVKDMVELDNMGYIITNSSGLTSRTGIYAAGDVCVKNLRQVATAVGDGALAATALEKYVSTMHAKTGIQAPKPTARQLQEQPKQEKQEKNRGYLFTPEIEGQLNAVFARMTSPLTLELHLDDGPHSTELKGYMTELAKYTDKLTVTEAKGGDHLPIVKVLRAGGQDTGLAFHGVPGGHEFTSFILGLYNAAGPGQPLDSALKARIEAIDRPVDIKIIVSLSCTMCPDLVIAAQHIAALSPNVSAHVYDLNHCPDLKEKYNIMSVPCFIVDDNTVHFGKKNIAQLLDIIG
ncbi:MAG: FAD-dependent oxidoreductase [Selenomonadales bacterium]|nr:FAD-dependent oxidoreductase [Selenomonadales bacterium]